MSDPADAQVIERNLPPPPPSAASALPAPRPDPPERDATPIGPALTALVALAPADPVRSSAQAGLDLASLPHLNTATARDALRPFIGQLISRKLIADIQAAITLYYRRSGFPFVAVTPPEQEISAGVLQLRVVEFAAGVIKATNTRRTPTGYVESRIRLQPGEPIDAARLSEDLDWLNRNPFRQVGAIFSPGDGLGRTNLTLPVTEVRPWRVYGGYASSGSAASGRDRYLLGAQAASLPFLPDALASYQLTGAADGFSTLHPSYISHAGRLSVPFAPRQAVDFTYDHVETNEPVQAFVVRQLTDEASVGYRTALSTLIPSTWAPLPGDITVGVEARQSARQVFFGDAVAQRGGIDILQVFGGYSGSFVDSFGGSSLSFTLHVSPGGVNGRNTDGALSTYSRGASPHAEYVYVNGQASRLTRLPFGLALVDEAVFQWAGDALPQTEQIAIGGPSLARGYSLDDGAFDSAVVIRNSLQGPSLRILPSQWGVADGLQPRLILDVGYGHARALNRDATNLSAGVGADYRFAARLALSADAACALLKGSFTRSGDCRVESRVTLSY